MKNSFPLLPIATTLTLFLFLLRPTRYTFIFFWCFYLITTIYDCLSITLLSERQHFLPLLGFRNCNQGPARCCSQSNGNLSLIWIQFFLSVAYTYKFFSPPALNMWTPFCCMNRSVFWRRIYNPSASATANSSSSPTQHKQQKYLIARKIPYSVGLDIVSM